jgi:hypothetical protein
MIAYNLETILAEKLHTMLSQNIGNIRGRDFDDICIPYSFYQKDFNNAKDISYEETCDEVMQSTYGIVELFK